LEKLALIDRLVGNGSAPDSHALNQVTSRLSMETLPCTADTRLPLRSTLPTQPESQKTSRAGRPMSDGGSSAGDAASCSASMAVTDSSIEVTAGAGHAWTLSFPSGTRRRGRREAPARPPAPRFRRR
jgi:hypothetical protein